MTQLELPLTDATESQADRCRRILAGIVGVSTASALTFDEATAREAARIERQSVLTNSAKQISQNRSQPLTGETRD